MRFFLICVLLTGLIQGNAFAGKKQIVYFNDTPGALTMFKLREWMSQNPYTVQNASYALVHLNNDASPEIMVRLPNFHGECSKLRGCQYLLFAQGNDELVLLGSFEAFTVYVEGQTPDGLKNLIVCDNPWNDFDCRTYTYQAGQGKYGFNEK